MTWFTRGSGRRNRVCAAARVSAFAALALVAPTALSGCGSTSAPAVASVQGAAISRAALVHWTRIKRIELQSSAAPKSALSAVQLQRKALAFLITADWLQAEAAAQHLGVSPSEVNATYQQLVTGPNGQAATCRVAACRRRTSCLNCVFRCLPTS